MGLRVFLGKNNFYKADEGDFFFHYAYVLKQMFKDGGYDGILLGVPFTKGQPNEYLQLDAVLFAKNAIIVVDFKSHGGKITTPATDALDEYRRGYWHTTQPGPDPYIKGGVGRPNPFVQVQDYATTIKKDILFSIPGAKKWRINTGVIFYGNDADVSEAWIPDRIKSEFFIANNDIDVVNPFRVADFYYCKVKSILSSKGREEKRVKLSDDDLMKIREKFNVSEELTDEFFGDLIRKFEAKLDKSNAEKERIQVELFKKEVEIINQNKKLEQKERELERKDSVIAGQKKVIADNKKTNELLAGKNLALMEEGKQKDTKIAETQHELVKTQHELIKEKSENKKLKVENRKHELERGEFQQEIEELKKRQDLSPDITDRLEQIYYDVKTLKIRDYNKEINDSWEQKFSELKQELSEIKEDAGGGMIVMPSVRPKWMMVLASSVAFIIGGLLIGAVINSVVPKNEELAVAVSRPEILEGPYRVNSVRDGDTIYVDYNGKSRGVRLIGIEAPETEDSSKEGSRCFNKQAKSYLNNKVSDSEVYLEYDESQGEVDAYDRLIRYVWIDDELVNLSLIEDGYAKEFTFNNEYKYKDQFNKAQAKAKRDGLGLWTTCAN